MTVLISGLLGALIAALVNILMNWWNRRQDRKKSNMAYAALWGAVLTELRHALDRMESSTRYLLEKQQRISSYEINLLNNLASSYVIQSKHPEVSEKVYEIYNNIIHFRESYHQYIESAYKLPLLQSGTIPYQVEEERLKRHLGGALCKSKETYDDMRKNYSYCLEQLKTFCSHASPKLKLNLNGDLPRELKVDWPPGSCE